MLNKLTNYLNNLNFSKKMTFNFDNRIDFYYEISKLMGEGGLTFPKAIRELRNMELSSSDMNAIKSPLYYIYNEIGAKCAQGSNPSKAMADYIPMSDQINISSFEDSDRIADGFSDLVEYNEQVKLLHAELIKTVAFPSIMMLMLYSVMAIFSLKIIPSIIETMSPDVQLSTISAAMVWMSNNFYLWSGVLFGVVIGIVLFLMWALPNYNTKLRLKLENYPPFSLYKINIGCSMIASLNNLTKSGKQQDEAIRTMSKHANPYLKKRLDIISHQMAQGKTIGAALLDSKLNFPDKKIVQFLAILSKHGALDGVLDKITKSILERGLKRIQLQSKILQAVMFLLLGSGIMFNFASLYQINSDMTVESSNTK